MQAKIETTLLCKIFGHKLGWEIFEQRPCKRIGCNYIAPAREYPPCPPRPGSSMKIFLVCEWAYFKDEETPHIEITGVFSTEQKAVTACITDHHFYGEFELDKANHEKHTPWPTEDPYPIKINYEEAGA